jgi:heme iron utilization protein
MGNSEHLRKLLKSLFASQRFAVLATQLSGQPYSNLILFAETDDLSTLLFVTSRNTRKYTNIMANKKVALLIDSRTGQKSDLNKSMAVTALGTVQELSASEGSPFAEIYTSKHPDLVKFISRPENALMKIMVTDYIVASFETVEYLHIKDNDNMNGT